MKITYPECQVEISVDEVIELNNYYEEQKSVITCRFPELHGLNPVDFDKFRLNVKDKEWLEETLKDSLVKLHKQLLEQTDPSRHGEGIASIIQEEPAPETKDPLAGVSFDDPEPEPKPYPLEEEPAPTFEPGGIIGDGERSPIREGVRPGGLPAAVQEALKHPHVVSKKEAKKKKSSGKPKKVDVLFETGWKTFGSLTEAAKAIDARMNHLSHAMLTGKTCNGHQVRYSNPELDAALAEIEESKKKPYQPTPPIR